MPSWSSVEAVVPEAETTGEEVTGYKVRGERGQIMEDVLDLWLLLQGSRRHWRFLRERDMIYLVS